MSLILQILVLLTRVLINLRLSLCDGLLLLCQSLCLHESFKILLLLFDKLIKLAGIFLVVHAEVYWVQFWDFCAVDTNQNLCWKRL